MNKGVLAGLVLLCAFFEGAAQSNVPVVSQKYVAYQSTWPKPRLHLIFNQDKFSPGDTAWFKAYFLTEDLIGVAGKQWIDLNLVDSRGESKLHFLFNVIDGLGHNQLALPNTLPEGIYLVTAHSSWMKNFDPVLIFTKKILIVSKNTLEPDEKHVVRAVAEGGHLIGDITNKISIRTYRPASSVQIMDATRQEIASTSTDANGTAVIIFKPLRKASYFVHVSGDTTHYPLPATEDDGLSLLLTPAGNGDPAKILVASPPASALRDQELAIIVSAKGKIYYSATFRQGTKEVSELQIPQENLPEGIVHVSLLNHFGELQASRDFYNQRSATTGRSQGTAHAKVQAVKHDLQPREKVRLEVYLEDSKGQPLEGEFAISVINAGLFDSAKQNSLSDELSIPSASREDFRIDRSDPNGLASLDNYLILNTEEVPWKKILSGQATRPRFPFTSAIQKSGKAYFGDSHKPVPDLAEIFFYLQRGKVSYRTTVEKGKVSLAFPDLYGQDELFYTGETSYYMGGVRHGEEIPNLKIEWEEEPIQLPLAPRSKDTEIPDRYATFVANSRLIERSFGFYSSREGKVADNRGRKGVSDFEDEFTEADISVKVQDYTLFPTMAELVREVIPSLQHRKTGRKSIVRVILPEAMWAMATGDPVYIIDGIATKNTVFFLSLKPSDLLTVKIVTDANKLRPLGMMGKNGIVIVQTKKGDVREPLDDSKLIEGLNRPVNFPDSGVQDPHRPDFRSTIYWNPSVKTDSSGKAIVEFSCSDDTGKLSIRIDGLATGGRPFSAEEQVEVLTDPGRN